jgi:uncharacterized protein (UPF0548 family)
MFLAHRPSLDEIQRFIDASRRLPLSYEPVGLAQTGGPRYRVDEQVVRIGAGAADFARAAAALRRWRHFDLGWVELSPAGAAVAAGTVVAVVIRHVGFWSLNGCRVLYQTGDPGGTTFGFAYGTLTNHAESGEELFEVRLDPATGEVIYRIRAASRPRAALARLGFPLTRLLQARFRRDSAHAVQSAVAGLETGASLRNAPEASR